MALTTVLSPNFFVTPATSMAKSVALIGKLLRERHVRGLAGMEIARGAGLDEHGLNHEHELRPIVAVVENRRRVFRLRREVAHARVERRAAGDRDAHRVAGLEG